MEITAKFIMMFAELIYTILEMGTDLFPVDVYKRQVWDTIDKAGRKLYQPV